MGLLILFLFALAWIIAIGTLALIHHMLHPRRKTFAVAMARGKPTDPREIGLTAQEVTFRFDDGETSPGWIIEGQRQSPAGSGQGPKSAPTIIITHGLNDSRFGALKRVTSLVPFAARVVIYDLRGHGDSTAKTTTLTAKEPDDLMAVMNQVDDGSPFVLVGHSMGAGISIVAAAREQEESGVRSQESGEEAKATASKTQNPELRTQNPEPRTQNPEPRTQNSEPRTQNPEPRTQNSEPRTQNSELSPSPSPASRVIGVIAEAGYRFGMEPVVGYLWRKRIPPWPFVWLAGWHFAFWLGLRKRTFDRTVHAAKIACPLWLLHGMKDDLCPLRSAQQVAAAAPRGRLVTFDHCDHGCIALQDEAKYTQTLREFFEQIEAGEMTNAKRR